MKVNFDWNQKTGIEVTYLSNEGWLRSLSLPLLADGSYLFPSNIKDGIIENLFFEMHEGSWYVRVPRPLYLLKETVKINARKLKDQGLLTVRKGEMLSLLYIHEQSYRNLYSHNYVISNPATITIGRTEQNGIQYKGTFVSSNHAVIQHQQDMWKIVDLGSKNGTFVNGVRIREKQLRLGDIIYIYGLKIIIGIDFISINDMDERTSIRTRQLKPITSDIIKEKSTGVSPNNNWQQNEQSFFNRSPRKRLPLDVNDIQIEAPPMSLRNNSIPLLLQIGGSFSGMATSIMMGNYFHAFSSLLFPFLNRGYSDKQKQEYEEKRIQIYTKYLKRKEKEIDSELKKESYVLNNNYPELREVINYAVDSTHLWERRIQDDDFLTVRAGHGKIPLMASITYPRVLIEMEEDPLRDKMNTLVEKKVFLDDVPITFSLIEHFVSGVTGDENLILDFFYRVVMQIAFLHSYDEVKTIFLLSEQELERMSFIRYLPHSWNDQKTMRFIATSEGEAYKIGEYLKNQLEEDLGADKALNKILQTRPYFILFAFNRKLLETIEVLKEIMGKEHSIGLSILTLYGELPKDCSIAFRLESNGIHRIVQLRNIEKEDLLFYFDDFNQKIAGSNIKKISNIYLKTVSEEYSLPKMLSFLEMYRVGRIEHLNIRKRWSDSNPIESLAVPIGVSTDGSTFILDLHEKYQGPHGLVAGTTGSGKSEFLLTYVLSLAINFHPDEVSIVLIDYKGGGLAGAFEDPQNGIHLPHLVGTITNLDGTTINRSLLSLQSEIKRRQKIFNYTKSLVGEGTMDIYTYQRLYREKKVDEPLSHLFIISDEFAELKQQQPEVLEQLVSIARIGRSLGVHLILATQKPGGVVTDQILSNTKFRVCLKVQDRGDSMEMLKRPEAVEIRETGRFYLQVGNNELFALGQSAWSGAEYEPQDEVVSKRDKSIQIIDNTGNSVIETSPSETHQSTGRSQLVEIVRELSRIGKELCLSKTNLWLPELPERIDAELLDNNEKELDNRMTDSLVFYAGRLDDPEKQDQYTLSFDMAECGSFLVIGEPGSGKTTFIQSLLVMMTKKYSPDDINYYILDFSSRLLKVFETAPHCGGVLLEENEGVLNQFFKVIQGLVNERKRLFSQLEVSRFEEARKIKSFPLVLVVIDNLAGLRILKKGEQYYDNLHTFIKESENYGIKYIISVSHLNEVPSRIRQELPEHIVLQMKDKYEYFDALDCRVKYVPSAKKGRGLYVYDGRAIEMQVCQYRAEEDDLIRMQSIKELVGRIAEKYKNDKQAKKLIVINEYEDYEVFSKHFSKERIPLGYYLDEGTEVALPLKQLSMLSVYMGNEKSIVPAIDGLLYAAKRESAEILFGMRQSNSCYEQLKNTENVNIFSADVEGFERMYKTLAQEIKKRHPIFEEYCIKQGFDQSNADVYKKTYKYTIRTMRPIMVFLERFADLCITASDQKNWITIFSSIFLIARRYQIYFFGFFYPNEEDILQKSLLYSCFNPEKMVILIGGSDNKQCLLKVPYKFETKNKQVSFNHCLMNYGNEVYSLIMPLGAVKENLEEDDLPIFGV